MRGRGAGLVGRWRYFRHRRRIAVIGRFGDDEAGSSAGLPGDPQGQIVALAAGAGEHDVGQRARKGRQQLFGVVVNGGMQIAGVNVDLAKLPAHRFDDLRMAMADRRYVIVEIQIAPPVGGVEIGPPGAHHFQRLAIEQHRARAERLPAPGDQGRHIIGQGARLRLAKGVQRQDLRRLVFHDRPAPALAAALACSARKARPSATVPRV